MKVLFVQEKPFLSTALKLTLSLKGYDLVFSPSNSLPVSIIDEVNPAVLITEINTVVGIKYLIEAKKRNVPVIVISQNGKEDELQRAFNLGADDYMCIPLSLQELTIRVNLLAKLKMSMAA